MKKILVAYDESPGAEAALCDVEHCGFPDRSEAMVVTVADVWLPPEATKDEPGFPEREGLSLGEVRRQALEAVAYAEEIAEDGAELLRALCPRWTIGHAALPDSPAWGILSEARKFGADTIVIGSHGRSPLEKFFLGSVSVKVAVEAHCSVRIFRERRRDSDPGLRILIAADGSPDADLAIAEALSRNWPKGTKFELVSVLDDKLRMASLWNRGVFGTKLRMQGVAPDDSGGASDRVAHSILSWLESHAAKFKGKGFETAAKVLEGEPKGMILRQAEEWEADCIFLGARGQHHGQRLYLGTLASAIATRARCTVEIVRATTRAS